MRYDEEYNSYKFSIDELVNVVSALTFYSRYSPLDKITKEKVKSLIDEFNKLSNIPIG